VARRVIHLLRQGFPERPDFDGAVSRALLEAAAAGEVSESFRLFVPGRVLAFGVRDTARPAYPAAVAAARQEGFSPVERLAGGRAAVFHEHTLAFAWAIPDPEPRRSIRARFEELAGVVVEALAGLGVDARIGEVPGEYCPGRHSVSHRQRLKLMGVGQRLSRNAAHVGGVIVVGGAQLVNRPLIPVYEALGIPFDPAVTGSLRDIDSTITVEQAAAAVLAEVAARDETVEGGLEARTIRRARELVADHLADGGSARR